MNGSSGCWIVHGHRGAGKTLIAMDVARQYLERGRPVASNMTINLDHLLGARNKRTYTKLPGMVRSIDLAMLGNAYPIEDDYDESKNGLVIIDECGFFLNAREWNHPDRKEVFRWITQSRKMGWDLILLIQDFETLDAQMRRSLADEVVSAMCLDRVKIPFLPFRLPKVHMYVGHYKGENGVVTFRKYLRGTDLYRAYNTKEQVDTGEVVLETGAVVDMRGSSTGLSAWHLVGRYLPPQPSAAMFFGFIVKWLLAWPALMAPRGRSPRGAQRAGAFRADLARLFPLLMPHVAREVADKDRVTSAAKAPRPPQALAAHSEAAYRLYRYREALRASSNGVQGSLTPAETAHVSNVVQFPRVRSAAGQGAG